MMNAENVTVPVIANAITDASMSPTQGVQRNPRERPIKKPEIKPVLPCERGINRLKREKSFSTID